MIISQYKLVVIIFFIAILTSAQNKITKPQIEIADSPNEVCPLKIGQEVPSAYIHNIEGELRDIKQIINGKNSIIIFYRGGWCPYCNLHLSEIQSIENDLVSLGYQILAISMDKPEFLRNTIQNQKINYRLFSDSKGTACSAFRIAFIENEIGVNKLKKHNMDIEEYSGNSKHILPVPSLFITDKEGLIKYSYVNPNYKVRINSKLLLETAKILIEAEEK